MSTISLTLTGNGSSPRAWTSQSYLDVDEGVAAADGTAIAALNGTNNNDTSFLLSNTPADFSSMVGLLFNVRYRQQNRSNDTLGLQIRIMSGATVLAANDSGGTFQSVAAGITTTTFTNTGATAFTYVNTTATASDWDGAQVEFRQTYSTTGANDNAHVEVDALDLTGWYAVTAIATGFSFSSATVMHATLAADRWDVGRLDDTHALAVYGVYDPAVGTSSDVYAQVVTDNGASASLGTPTLLGTEGSRLASPQDSLQVAILSSTSAIVVGARNDGSVSFAYLLSISGTAVSASSRVALSADFGGFQLTRVDSTRAAIFYNAASTAVDVRMLTASGGSVSESAATNVVTSVATVGPRAAGQIDTNRVILYYTDDVSGVSVIYLADVAVTGATSFSTNSTTSTVSQSGNAQRPWVSSGFRFDSARSLLSGSSVDRGNITGSTTISRSAGSSIDADNGASAAGDLRDGSFGIVAWFDTTPTPDLYKIAVYDKMRRSIAGTTTYSNSFEVLSIAPLVDGGRAIVIGQKLSSPFNPQAYLWVYGTETLTAPVTAVPPLRIGQRDDSVWTPRLQRKSTARQDTPRVGRNSYW